MKRLFVILVCAICTTSLFAQKVDFTLRSDGSFVNADDGKSYMILSVPGMSAEELYYAFLVALRQKCEYLSGHLEVVENKAINVCDYESKLYLWNVLPTSTPSHYYHYNFLFQFKDGIVRIEAPIVSCCITRNDNYHRPFESFLEYVQLFQENGTLNPKREKAFYTIISNVNHELASFIEAALRVNKW